MKEIIKIAQTLKDWGVVFNVGKEQRLNPSTKKMLEETPNLLHLNWVKTNPLLRHPHTKVFVTHGGLNSF